MTDSDLERAQRAFERMVSELLKRGGTGRPALTFEVTEEFLSAAVESTAKEQDEAEITDVKFQFFPDAALVSAQVRVKARAWPPRPPVNTRIEFGAREITHSEAGKSGSVMFRVEKPLTFSSTFADVIIGLLGKLIRGGPVSLDSLRHKDALITLDFSQLVGMLRPELAANAAQVRLYNLKVSQGTARVEVGFVK
jgi:hypothetical protein